MFTVPSPGKDQPDNDFLLDLNPNSVEIYSQALAEPSILDCAEGEAFQLERLGYFCIDKDDMESTASPDAIEMKKEKTPLKVNRVVTLKDTWASRAAPLDSSSSSSSSSAKHAPVKDVSSLPEILRVELRVGKITSATLHPDADSLYIESVDCGEEAGGVRTIISGLAKFIPIDSLIGRKVVVVCNLKPSKMRGVVSEGMLLAASNNVDGEEVVELLEAPEDSKVGDLLQIEGLEKAQPDAVLKSKTQQDMYKRVSALFRTNGEGEATFDGKKFLTSEGNSISVATLKNAPIR